MIGLRRSVLALQVPGGVPQPWPPPDADAVPDAVVVPFADGAIASALAALDGWGVDCLVDAPPAAIAGLPLGGVTSVVVRDGPVAHVQDVDAALGDAEQTRGIAAGTIAIELMLTGPGAFLDLDALLAASPRVASVIADPAVLLTALGLERSVEVDQLAYPRGRMTLAAAHRRVPAVGRFWAAGHHAAAAQAAGLDDTRFSFAVGLHGGLCHDWEDVRACNSGFLPDEGRVQRARRILEAMEEAGRKGLGAISLDGRMIDIPFIAVSRATLDLAERAAARTEAVRRIVGSRGVV